MAFIERARTEWIDLKGLGRMLANFRFFLPQGSWNSARLLRDLSETLPNQLGIVFEDQRWTWRDVSERTNQYAHFFVEHGISRSDVVALFMDNRPDYLFALTGLNRIRAVGALINHNLTGKTLAHAINVARPKGIVTGGEHIGALAEVLPELDEISRERNVWVQRDDRPDPQIPDGYRVINEALDSYPRSDLANIPRPKTSEPMCYIYTSGTTGLPKAAVITNQRWLVAGTLFGRMMGEATPRDVIYLPLPLYHSNGMFGGWGASLISGATLALRRKFSASNFWKDVRNFDATIFIYIGELCRYLLNHPPTPEEREHRLRLCIGNGLRPDIWEKFQGRFGVPLIREFYGATEGNTPLVNLVGRPGMVGRLRPGQVIVRCDHSTGEVIRSDSELCQRVQSGEKGLLLGRITAVMKFDGYVDSSATEKKILRDVLKKGDSYFNTGDIMQLHPGRWVSFADRAGDTFRWKGENVSTNEVAEILNGAHGVLESNVYGVKIPGTEGRAGMASIRTSDEFDLKEFARFVSQELPNFQRPYFIRLQQDMRITSTFKHQKADYREEGYDPSKVRDPLYYLDGEEYVPVTEEVYRGLVSGEIVLR